MPLPGCPPVLAPPSLEYSASGHGPAAHTHHSMPSAPLPLSGLSTSWPLSKALPLPTDQRCFPRGTDPDPGLPHDSSSHYQCHSQHAGDQQSDPYQCSGTGKCSKSGLRGWWSWGSWLGRGEDLAFCPVRETHVGYRAAAYSFCSSSLLACFRGRRGGGRRHSAPAVLILVGRFYSHTFPLCGPASS